MVPAYLVRTDREETLREVFGRINSTGRKLEQSQVFDALHGARTRSRPASVPQIVAELEALRFGKLEEKLLYRLLRVLLGRDVVERKDEGPPRLSESEAESAYRETAETARRVIQFLVTDVGIPRYDLLPYKQPIVMLGKFFHFNPSPKARSRELLARWVWRGALNGAHRGDTVSTTANLERIVQGGEEISVQKLLAMVARRPDDMPSVHNPFNFRRAASKLQTLALLDLHPRDLESGEPIFDDPSSDLGDDDLPIPSIVTGHGGDIPDLRSVANRLIHPRRHGLRRLLTVVRNPLVLTSHGISEAALERLQEGDVEGFLTIRAEFLQGHFDRFFARHARWDESDRPSIEAILGEAEED